MMIKNPFIILCGPSGAGKSTLLKNMIQAIEPLTSTISLTTREKRPYEKEAKDYFFVSQEKFFQKIKEGDLLEWAQVYGYYYGTSKKQVEKIWSEGKAIIKDLDLQGLQSVKESYPQCLAVGVFPSSKEEAKNRMASRKAGPHENLELRLTAYTSEVEQLKKCVDLKIINDDLKRAVAELEKKIKSYLFQKID